MGSSGPFRGIARAAKVTTFYKIRAIIAFFAAISASYEGDFQRHRDGHFCARDGHYVSNDHRERKNDGFRVAGKLPFSAPQHPRRAYRQTADSRKALARCRNGRNVYLCNIRKNFTIQLRELSVSLSSQGACTQEALLLSSFYLFTSQKKARPGSHWDDGHRQWARGRGTYSI